MTKPSVQVLLDDGSGAWAYDVSTFVDLRQGISINRGRQDEFGEVQASTCSMTLDNTDGRFTFGRAPTVVNLISNGSFEQNSAGWTVFGDPMDVASVTSPTAPVGSASLRMTATIDGTLLLDSTRFSVTPGSNYSIQARFRAATTTRPTYLRVVWYDSTGALIPITTSNSDYVGETTTSWFRQTLTVTAPTGATTAAMRVGVLSVVASESHYVDAAMAQVGSTASATYIEAPMQVRIDTPIKVITTTNGVPSERFTGYVNTWPVEWPGGSRYAEAKISATDAMARLERRKLRSVIEHSVDVTKAAFYYPLTEPSGARSAGDVSGKAGPALSVVQRGTGGTVEFGSGTGPPTDGKSAVTFSPADASNGQYLRGYFATEPFRQGISFYMRGVFNTSTVAAQTFYKVVAANSTGYGLEIGLNTAGRVIVRMGSSVDPRFTLTDTVSSADGSTHDVVVTLTPMLDEQGHAVSLYVDGVFRVQANSPGDYFSPKSIIIGGGPSAYMATATLSHFAVTQGEITDTAILDLHHALVDGFTSDSSDERIGRYAHWANLDSTPLWLESGSLTSVAHQDTTGMSPAAAMRAVAAAEQGLVFIDGTGGLVFQNRSHRYSPTPKVTLDADDIGTDSSFVVDTQGLINSVTASREGGATQVFEVASSVAKYEQYPADLSLLVTTDEDALQAAAWVANTNAEPTPRLPSVSVDLLTQTAAVAASVQAVELGDALTLTGLPSQAPASSVTLFAEGWQEDIGTEAWSQTFNTSPLDTVWVLQDPVFGALDSTFRLAF